MSFQSAAFFILKCPDINVAVYLANLQLHFLKNDMSVNPITALFKVQLFTPHLTPYW